MVECSEGKKMGMKMWEFGNSVKWSTEITQYVLN